MWTCTALGDPCILPFVSRGVSFDVCTQQFSDLYDADGDGNLHNGHPRCTSALGESLCGPCSCGPDEQQGCLTSSVCLHTSPVALITCTPCVAGKFKLLGNNSGLDECELCPPGNSSSGGATVCSVCVAGRHSDLEWSLWTASSANQVSSKMAARRQLVKSVALVNTLSTTARPRVRCALWVPS